MEIDRRSVVIGMTTGVAAAALPAPAALEAAAPPLPLPELFPYPSPELLERMTFVFLHRMKGNEFFKLCQAGLVPENRQVEALRAVTAMDWEEVFGFSLSELFGRYMPTLDGPLLALKDGRSLTGRELRQFAAASIARKAGVEAAT